MVLIHRYGGTLLIILLAVACALLATLQSSWLAELQAQSYFQFQGRAEKLGTQSAKVTIDREFTFNGNLGDLRETTVTINSVLNEAGLDLVAGADLPIILSASRGGKKDEVIFRSPDRVHPQIRIELKRKGGGLFTLRLVIEFADSIPPDLCTGTPATTNLTTSVTITGQTTSVGVTTTQPWKCMLGTNELRI
jgi:hypothetical protein